MIDFCVGAAAVFVAVLLGLAVDNKREALRKEQDRRDLLCDFHSELEETDSKLTGARFPNRLRTVTWDSAVASGQLRLLSSDQMRSYTDVYNFIKEVDS